MFILVSFYISFPYLCMLHNRCVHTVLIVSYYYFFSFIYFTTGPLKMYTFGCFLWLVVQFIRWSGEITISIVLTFYCAQYFVVVYIISVVYKVALYASYYFIFEYIIVILSHYVHVCLFFFFLYVFLSYHFHHIILYVVLVYEQILILFIFKLF